MKTRWKIREEYFRGADTYEFKLKTGDEARVIPLAVDAQGYFHLSEEVPAGLYGFAEFVRLTEDPG